MLISKPHRKRPVRPPGQCFSPFGSRLISGNIFCALVLVLLPGSARALEPVAGRRGMVVSSEPLASQAGVEILQAGGNAVDAAVAVGFALAVTYPSAGNIGGGGFMLVRLANGRTEMVDYREEAPRAATHNMYQDAQGNLIPDASTVGALAVGVPGTVAGLVLAEKKYGKVGLAAVLKPAIRLAEEGFPVSFAFDRSLREDSDLLNKFVESRRIFLREGHFYKPGETFKQTDLAKTLRLVELHGADGFYRGPVAEALVATMQEQHGLITLQDLGDYQAKLRQPLVGHFRGFTILTAPPPSSGGVGLIEMLNILDPLDLGLANSYHSTRLIVEAMRRAYADRSAYLGDTDFAQVPVAGLTSRKYADQLREQLLHAAPDAPLQAGKPQPYESPQTTHFSVVDVEGNAVANTYTLNGGYGSGVTVKGGGFLLNNEMDDFAAKPGAANMFGLVQGEANSIAPYKRPLSSMTPTIVLDDEQHLRLVLGSPGGGTIINTVLQVVLNLTAFHMDVLQAVISPRFHHQYSPDELVMEHWGFSADTLEKLQQAGYKIRFVRALGECEAIEVDPQLGWRFGAADSRGNGKAVGY